MASQALRQRLPSTRRSEWAVIQTDGISRRKSSVNSIVEGIFNPLIAAIFNAESLKSTLVVPLPGDGQLSFGLVLAALIQFLLVAAVVYFAFVVPVNHVKHVQERRRQAGLPPTSENAPATELDVLSEIRDLLAAGASAEAKRTP